MLHLVALVRTATHRWIAAARDIGDRTAVRLPDTMARLVQFTIVTSTRGGRAKTSAIRLLTTAGP
jgi:hypothetical protein